MIIFPKKSKYYKMKKILQKQKAFFCFLFIMEYYYKTMSILFSSTTTKI